MYTKNTSASKPVLHASGWSKLVVPGNLYNFAVTGHESQVLTMRLQAGESLQGEPGSMLFLTNGVKQHITYEGCCARCCAGESCCVVHFTNVADEPAYAAVSPNFPTAKVVPVNLASPHVNGVLIAQQGSFLASSGIVTIGVSMDWNCMRCCCSGLGLVRQQITGTGTVFLASTGTIVEKVLQPGETILVDTHCVMAFASSCTLDLQQTGGVVGMMGGGEGVFNTTLTGPGLVIIQSMNESIFRQAMMAEKLYRR